MLKEKLRRVFAAGWKNFRRNRYVSIGTTGVMSLVLLLFLCLVGVNFLGSVLVQNLEGKVDVRLYLKNEATDDEVKTIRTELEALNSVKYVDFVSREQALAEFKERHANDALIQQSLSELPDNPLQAWLNIKATDATQYASIVGFLEASRMRSVIDKINYYDNEAVIGRIQGISHAVQNWGMIGTLLLAFISVLVAFNTVRLTIYNQKQEIEIQRLVGASNWYIRAPYMIEGVLYGGFATAIALVLFFGGLQFASPKVAVLMPGVSLMGYFAGNVVQIIGMTLFAGIALGVVSSLVAIRRFLNV
ncbi:MAG TPA: permease-like cell division protein FtsX [Candidatus Paceibacterota bacterium]|nr:permease-like cell division protein FtsX [Candidatus Paceibacterota bacterium]